MQTYSVFGGVLSSSLPFPELLETDASPDAVSWRIERMTEVEPVPGLVEIGADPIAPVMTIRLYRGLDRYRIDYGPLGIYDISLDGSRIAWSPGIHDCDNCIRQCLLGRILALAIHARGGFCLHGSCLRIGGSGIAFLAPKGTGKSTLASALLAQGCSLITDDMLHVSAGDPPACHAGVQRLRLWSDSAEAAADNGIPSHRLGEGKHITTVLPTDDGLKDHLPLGAIYLLTPDELAQPVPHRERLQGSDAAIALISNSMLQSLLATEGTTLLRQAVGIAARVPVYRLFVKRGYEHLPSIAATLIGWHPEANAAEDNGRRGGSGLASPSADVDRYIERSA